MELAKTLDQAMDAFVDTWGPFWMRRGKVVIPLDLQHEFRSELKGLLLKASKETIQGNGLTDLLALTETLNLDYKTYSLHDRFSLIIDRLKGEQGERQRLGSALNLANQLLASATALLRRAAPFVEQGRGLKIEIEAFIAARKPCC